MDATPFVSIVIPCRNEKNFIAGCLDSILHSDYPIDRLEILVVDGRSEDGTREIVEGYTRRYPCIKLVDNPRRTIPVAMNLGIGNSTGSLVMKMDAHSTYDSGYISNCIKYISQHNADNVGGILKTTPRTDTLMARAIALALSHPFGAGNSHFRIGSKKPMWVDTVFGGCYRREIFSQVGLFNEDLPKGSDIDLNVRLRRAGGRILLVPEIVAYYYSDATLLDFWKHNFVDGAGIFYRSKFGSRPLIWRHHVAFAFVSGLIVLGLLSLVLPIFLWPLVGLVGSYCLAICLSSLQIAAKNKGPRLLFVLPLAFATRHVAYGLGSLVGLLHLLVPKRYGKNQGFNNLQ